MRETETDRVRGQNFGHEVRVNVLRTHSWPRQCTLTQRRRRRRRHRHSAKAMTLILALNSVNAVPRFRRWWEQRSRRDRERQRQAQTHSKNSNYKNKAAINFGFVFAALFYGLVSLQFELLLIIMLEAFWARSLSSGNSDSNSNSKH